MRRYWPCVRGQATVTFDSDLVDFGRRCYNLARWGRPATPPAPERATEDSSATAQPVPVVGAVAWGNFRTDGTCVGLTESFENTTRWINPRPLFLSPQPPATPPAPEPGAPAPAIAAQAVLDAYETTIGTSPGLAAALRAATDQVVPAESENENFDDCNHDEKAEWLQWCQRMEDRRKFLAIAAELEGFNA